MATNIPLISEEREDNYELELSRVRENIKSKFVGFIDCLKARESELLRELDNILASYLSYRSELEKVSEKKIEIEEFISLHRNRIQSSHMKSIHGNVISQLNTELKSIETPTEPKMVTLECDSNKLFAELNKLANLTRKLRSGIDYKSKKQPLVSVCEKGKGMEQLNYPEGVTVDNKTGNIFIADCSNNCVKVFDSTGKCLYKFGDNKGEGRMCYPRGVAICGDRILITQESHCILNYQLNGKFISRIGREGKRELEFNAPFGLTIDESNGDIYICDYYNNRIQILSTEFCFKSQFGKLSKEYICVLDASNPCLHLFSYNHILQKSVISRGTGMQVLNPWYFFIDPSDNILISDRVSNSILIYSPQFQLFHKISVSNSPMGVTVDTQGRLIVVSQSDTNCLQIY